MCVAIVPFSPTCWEGERQEFSQPPSPCRAPWSKADRSWGWEEEGPPWGWACLQSWLNGSLPDLWQVKPVVSQFLQEKQLPYNEDTYLTRFRLFLSHYEELMVQTPPITELVGLQ